MTVLVVVECSACGAPVDAGQTAKQARSRARTAGVRVSLPGGHDLCAGCWFEGWRIVQTEAGAWVPRKPIRGSSRDN